MIADFTSHLRGQLAELESAGLYKHERVIDSPQSAEIHVLADSGHSPHLEAPGEVNRVLEGFLARA